MNIWKENSEYVVGTLVTVQVGQLWYVLRCVSSGVSGEVILDPTTGKLLVDGSVKWLVVKTMPAPSTGP